MLYTSKNAAAPSFSLPLPRRSKECVEGVGSDNTCSWWRPQLACEERQRCVLFMSVLLSPSLPPSLSGREKGERGGPGEIQERNAPRLPNRPSLAQFCVCVCVCCVPCSFQLPSPLCLSFSFIRTPLCWNAIPVAPPRPPPPTFSCSVVSLSLFLCFSLPHTDAHVFPVSYFRRATSVCR